MAELKFIKGKALTFEEDTHTYRYNDKVLISTTQLLEEQGIKRPMPNTRKVMEAAEFGSLVHNEIDQFIKTGKKGITAEFRWFERNVFPLAVCWDTEVMFCTDDYAGRIDAIGFCSDGTYILVDFKTGIIYEEAVAYQESLYYEGACFCGILNRNKKVRFLCVDLKGDNGRLIWLDRIPQSTISDLVHCHKIGTRFEFPHYDAPSILGKDIQHLTDDEECTLQQLLSRADIGEKLNILDSLEKECRMYKDNLKQRMMESNSKRAKTPSGHWFTLSYSEKPFLKKELILQNYPKLGQKIIDKCTVMQESVSLRYVGERAE